MLTSGLLAAFVLVVTWTCGWAVRHFGAGAGEPPLKLAILFWGFVLGGVVAGAAVFRVDFQQRRVTLFEELVEGGGTASTSKPGFWQQSFAVEHPGAEHTLRVHPKLGFGVEAARPVYLAVKLSSKHEVYVDETATFRPSEPDLLEILNPRGPDKREWESHHWTFTPQSQDPHTVAISIMSAEIANVLVRVEDPEKRDGRRAPGY